MIFRRHFVDKLTEVQRHVQGQTVVSEQLELGSGVLTLFRTHHFAQLPSVVLSFLDQFENILLPFLNIVSV